MAKRKYSEAPRAPFRVCGQTITIGEIYSEGHVIDAAEASALNQTFRENIRNGIRESVKANLADAQKIVDEYAATYKFGLRRSGIRLDPVSAEAKKLAKQQIDRKLAEKGISKKDFAAYDDRVEKLMAHPKIREVAEAVIKHRQINADLVGDKNCKRSTPTNGADDDLMSPQEVLDATLAYVSARGGRHRSRKREDIKMP